jgi:hypothetical protein
MFKEAIGNNRYLTAGIYKAEIMVHVREYETGNSKLYPTRKGVAFTKVRWATFMTHFDDIDRCVELLKTDQPVEYSQHIGGKYYVTISQGMKCINIRRYFLPLNSKKERPTRSGIALRLDEWGTLATKVYELHERIPELKVARPCYASDDHANQLGYLNCRECNPFALELDLAD